MKDRILMWSRMKTLKQIKNWARNLEDDDLFVLFPILHDEMLRRAKVKRIVK